MRGLQNDYGPGSLAGDHWADFVGAARLFADMAAKGWRWCAAFHIAHPAARLKSVSKIGNSPWPQRCVIGSANIGACPVKERSISLADICVAAAKPALMLAP
jgi:hypothetical protein